MRQPSPTPGLCGDFSAVRAPQSKTSAPFSLRLTYAERAELEARAGGAPLGAYIKRCLFDGSPPKPRRHRVQNSKAMARALALLGQSRIASNLNQLARAANVGTLPVTPDVEADLQEACAHVSDIRSLLVEAMGLKTGGRA